MSLLDLQRLLYEYDLVDGFYLCTRDKQQHRGAADALRPPGRRRQVGRRPGCGGPLGWQGLLECPRYLRRRDRGRVTTLARLRWGYLAFHRGSLPLKSVPANLRCGTWEEGEFHKPRSRPSKKLARALSSRVRTSNILIIFSFVSPSCAFVQRNFRRPRLDEVKAWKCACNEWFWCHQTIWWYL